MQGRLWITLSLVCVALLSGRIEAQAAGETATIVIETRIKKKTLSFQAGMKSTQTINIDYDAKRISDDFRTGVTELLGVQLKSVRDNFTVKRIKFAGKVASFEAEGETASGVVFMPNINYKFAITVDLSANEIVFSGCHDGYPSYRITVRGTEAYSFEQENATALFGSCDINVPHTVKKF
jgi:hypothetical protein